MFIGLVLASSFFLVHRQNAWVRHFRDPMMAQFYGAPPMAALTVAGGGFAGGAGAYWPGTHPQACLDLLVHWNHWRLLFCCHYSLPFIYCLCGSARFGLWWLANAGGPAHGLGRYRGHAGPLCACWRVAGNALLLLFFALWPQSLCCGDHYLHDLESPGPSRHLRDLPSAHPLDCTGPAGAVHDRCRNPWDSSSRGGSCKDRPWL